MSPKMIRRLVSWAVTVVGASGCGVAASPVAPEVVLVAERATRGNRGDEPGGAVLLWRADSAATLGIASEWLEASPGAPSGLAVVARRAEPVVVTKRGLVSLRVVQSHPPLSACDACDAGACAPSGERGEVASLVAVDLAGDRTIPLTKDDDAPDSTEDAVGDFEVGVSVQGAVGPVVFFRRSGSGYGCGAAHPYFFSQPETIDLDTGASPTFAPPKRVAAELALTAKKALTQEHGDCLLDPDETPALFEVSPEIGPAGLLRASYTFIMGAPYVCGLGPDHYSVDHTVDDSDAPPGLAMARLPSWILPALASGPVTGIGVVTEGERADLLEAFRSAPIAAP